MGEKRQQQASISNRVFVSSGDVCLVICPCGKRGSKTRVFADGIYSNLILPVVKSLGLNPKRIDQISPTGDINNNLVSLLFDAPLCISVIDQHNPNVMIETGIRLAYHKPIVFLRANGTEIPFDIISQNCVEYDLSTAENTKRSIRDLTKHLKNPGFSEVSVFSANLAAIGAGYELSSTSRAKLLRLDRLIEDFRDFKRDIELDNEFDATYEKKLLETRKSHEAKLVTITDRLRHEITLLNVILNESSPGASRDGCNAFINRLQELQRSSETVRKKLGVQASRKPELLRNITSLIKNASTMRNGHVNPTGKTRRGPDGTKKS